MDIFNFLDIFFSRCALLYSLCYDNYTIPAISDARSFMSCRLLAERSRAYATAVIKVLIYLATPLTSALYHFLSISFSTRVRSNYDDFPTASRRVCAAVVSPAAVPAEEISAFTTIDSIFVFIVPIPPPIIFLHTYTTRHEVDHHADTIASDDPRAAAAREHFLESWAGRASVEFAMGPTRGIWVPLGLEAEVGSPLVGRFFASWKFRSYQLPNTKRGGGENKRKKIFPQKVAAVPRYSLAGINKNLSLRTKTVRGTVPVVGFRSWFSQEALLFPGDLLSQDSPRRRGRLFGSPSVAQITSLVGATSFACDARVLLPPLVLLSFAKDLCARFPL